MEMRLRKGKKVMDIIDDTERRGKNARQTMLYHKGAHGTGIDPEFPSKAETHDHMRGHLDDYYVEVYGDGSYTTPTKWWVALGGQGMWIKDWNAQ